MTTNLPATQRKDVQLVEYLKGKGKDFAETMPIKPVRFMRMLSNAILKDPQIAEASTRSVYLECMKAAADGLVLDGREATLTRFKSKDGMQVVYIPMVPGIMKRVRNSGEIQAWTCELVYEKEYETGKFKYVASPEPMITHEPIIVGERGPVVAAYSAVRLKDGSYHYEVMTVAQMNGIRKRSRAPNGPWSTDTEEMYRKTVIRRHAKRLPVSSEVLDVTQRVDDLYTSNVDELEESAPEPVRKTAAERMAEVMEADPVTEQAVDEVLIKEEYNSQLRKFETINSDTGEILEGEIVEDAQEINPEDDF